MAETDLSDWLPIADAAAKIGCSTRTIERLGRAKTLESRLRPQKGSPPVVVYNPDDVARIASERHQEPPPFVLPAVQASGNGNRHGTVAKAGHSPFVNFDEARAAMVAVVTDLARGLHANLSPPSPPVAETVAETKLFLTIAEAAGILGLPQADVRRAIAAGELPARKTGRGGYRIRRRDLECL